MIDIQWIRDHPEKMDDSLKKRGIKPCCQDLLSLDARVRQIKTFLQDIRTKKNDLASQTAQLRAQGQSADAFIQEASSLKDQETQWARDLQIQERELMEHLSWLPNILDDAVPYGKSEDDNIELRRWGEPNVLPNIKGHIELCQALNLIDVSAAVQLAGSRFVLLKGVLARLERALAAWMLDVHTTKFGYTEISPPYLVTKKTAFGSGNLPKFSEDLFETTTGNILIPTAEMPLVSLYAGQILEKKELPLRLTAWTPCFRSEAGSAGKDTHGMMRLHQFHKVELVSFCIPEESEKEHQRIVGQAEYLLQQLNLPYRVVLLCSGDTGFASRKTYDIEVFIPSENKYREISSCSNCSDFQARRVSTRFKNDQGKSCFVDMLNGSGLPIGRALIAILETYQNENGSITMPPILRPYMNGVDVLK